MDNVKRYLSLFGKKIPLLLAVLLTIGQIFPNFLAEYPLVLKICTCVLSFILWRQGYLQSDRELVLKENEDKRKERELTLKESEDRREDEKLNLRKKELSLAEHQLRLNELKFIQDRKLAQSKDFNLFFLYDEVDCEQSRNEKMRIC
jgi:hypothetical protein